MKLIFFHASLTTTKFSCRVVSHQCKVILKWFSVESFMRTFLFTSWKLSWSLQGLLIVLLLLQLLPQLIAKISYKQQQGASGSSAKVGIFPCFSYLPKNFLSIFDLFERQCWSQSTSKAGLFESSHLLLSGWLLMLCWWSTSAQSNCIYWWSLFCRHGWTKGRVECVCVFMLRWSFGLTNF